MLLLGLDQEEKAFKNAMQVAGANMSEVKDWLKVYEKTRKSSLTVAGQYYDVRNSLMKLLEGCMQMEAILRTGIGISGQQGQQFREILKSMRKQRGMFDSEFLISKADKDFHTTFDAVVMLGTKYVEAEENAILLQSEIENLIALIQEGLEREKPDLFALSYFYLKRSNKELENLTFPEKVTKVMRIYQTEFISEMQKQVVACMKQCDYLCEQCEGKTDKKSEKILQDLRPLIEMGKANVSPGRRAELLIQKMCSL